MADTRYLPYGEERWTSGGAVSDYTFIGQRAERGLGLTDYQARYYNPKLGRFVSADTIVAEPGNPQSLNRYSYVLNRPLQGGDPSGHSGPVGGVGALPAPTQPIDPVTLEQMAEALRQGVQNAGPYAPVVVGTAAVAAVAYVDIRYGVPMVTDWAMQDVGPAYPLPATVTPESPNVQPTWVLPGSSTLTLDSGQTYVTAERNILGFADKQRQIERQQADRAKQRAGQMQPQVPRSSGPPQGSPGQKPPRPPDDDNEIWRLIGETLNNPDIPVPQKVVIVSTIIVAGVTGNLQ